jgi:two-component system, cell cycle response regulator
MLTKTSRREELSAEQTVASGYSPRSSGTPDAGRPATLTGALKVLIADDSAVYRKLVEQTLEPESCTVLVARDGREAMDIIGREHPSLIITDWVMPDLTGIELCRRIRENAGPGYAYVILLTSNVEKVNVVRGLTAGADDYLTKPFDQGELLARVRVGTRLIDLHRQVEAKNRLLEELAMTDSLTTLPNRRAVEAWAGRQLSGAARHGFTLWAVLMDIDHFKSVNDTYGHEAGDTVLKRFAEIIRRNTRYSDISGRIGGEEFLQVLTHSNEKGVSILVERMREQFAAEQFDFGTGPVTVTASFGAAGFEGKIAPEFSTLVARADAALYRAKKLGRNRIEIETLQKTLV